MTERTIEFDTPLLTDETADALRAATDRAERAEAELARLKAHPQAAIPAGTTRLHTQTAPASQVEGDLFAAQDPQTNALSEQGTRADEQRRAERDRAANSQAERARNEHAASSDGAVHTEELKQPPTPSTAVNATGYDDATAVTERGSADRANAQSDGVDELRKDPMMAHLLDSLSAGTDVGHYGRLVFAMVARHFIPHAEVVSWLTKDQDFSPEQAQQMLHQVEGRDYNPPRRERLLQWQREQEFRFLDVHDPDSGNLYRNLEFPKEVYDHIGHYQEAKAAD